MPLRRPLLTAAFALAFAASLPAQAPDPRVALLQADARWSAAVAAGGVDAWADGLAADAAYLHAGAPMMHGRDAARGFAKAQPAGAFPEAWSPVEGAVSPDGTAGYTMGVALFRVAGANGAATPRAGRYVTFWRRDGERWVVGAQVVMAPQGTPLTVFSTAPSAWAGGVPTGAAAAMAQADRDFAAEGLSRGAGAAFGHYAAPDAMMWGGGGGLMRGPAAIAAAFGPGEWRWWPVRAGASADGALGFTVGEAEIAFPGENGAREVVYTKYLTIWQRQADGTYRFATDGGNPRPGPPAAR